MIPYGRQHLDDDDIEAVVSALKSDWLTQGPAVPKFEQAMASYCNANHAVATNSATSALHLACLALNVGLGDCVWTSPNSFVASANCALYCGADVDFVDIDFSTGNMCMRALAEKLEAAERDNTLPKVLIPVHFAGQSCDMAELAKLATRYQFRIIEDASHAVGARYNDKNVGSCEFSDICIFSFHPVKIITTMEGGMALTNNEELCNQMALQRSHGVSADAALLTEPSHGPWYYQQHSLGFNYRMNDVEAALGLSQLTKLPQFVEKRNQHAKRYHQLFSEMHELLAESQVEIAPLVVDENSYSSYHLYVVRFIGIDDNQHRQVITFLREQGIVGHVHYIPIYLQPYYQALGFKKGYCPNAETYYTQAVTLPLFPDLTPSQISLVADKVKEARLLVA
ncbi:UDP-4-amino-4,6-dideoxy-N-acetyl-beta-L-altrosamine transaminase [Alteromonas naphthalenivorans]|uniref:DegT/DnrJ/EryC1/StrS aminotransferase n=1 Tax=Alteromonas naphthalenivorans TaxID=715451 RepID=F5ZE71_ALTNA|nr:UDP-4-amino-4,6-dideoxy-N-acetyl-beta-L-altrosamine transaminase [Alteromonas naphthalenivorans]AEF04183.1 putative DegT/DnrJ/EryC1/StrS aminotransferase [Alteromonas naphthalenivorans]